MHPDDQKIPHFHPPISTFPSGSSSSPPNPPISQPDPLTMNLDTFSPPYDFTLTEDDINMYTNTRVTSAPQPLECLQGTPIPPFLSKTYDLVNDPNIDPIISWGSKGQSFVVWDPVEFSRFILPRNFKHNNFSSFVRQLNTYGFRKVDPDRWEFANEGFLRGNKQLLKNIHRRKSSQSQQLTSYGGSSSETASPGIGSEIERLRKEKTAMMEEVIELQQRHRGTTERMEKVKDRLQASEQRQKQMVSFLAKVFQNPAFVDRLKQMKEQRALDSQRARRKFLKQKHQEGDSSGASILERQVVRYIPDLPELGDFAPSDIPESVSSDFLLQDVVTKASTSMDSKPFRTENVPLSELVVAANLEVPEPVVTVTSSSGVGDPFYRGKQAASPEPDTTPEYQVSFPEELAKERTLPEFSSPAIDNILEQERVWSMGFDLSTDISVSSPGLWGHMACYDLPEVGISPSSDFPNIQDLGSLPAGSSGVERWPDDTSPLSHPENQSVEPRNDED